MFALLSLDLCRRTEILEFIRQKMDGARLFDLFADSVTLERRQRGDVASLAVISM